MFLLLLLSIPSVVFADTIKSIEVEANILDDGSMEVTQIWNATPDGGTEFFIPMQNLNHMELTDFKVSDENGPYTQVSPWDIEASFDEKANKYGINTTNDGIELCFGKSALESKTYIIKYNLKNAVIGFSDSDGFNIRFINSDMEPAPDVVKVTIQKNGVDLTDLAKFWAFGFYGNIQLEDGKIVAKNTDQFTSYNHVTILVSLDKGIINPTYNINDSFNILKSTAFIDSDYENSQNDFDGSPGDAINPPDEDIGFIGLIIGFCIIFPILVITVAIAMYSKKRTIAMNIKEVDKDHPDYYRDIPFDGNLPAMFYLMQKEPDILNGIVSAQILKWIGSGNISIEQVKNTGMLNKLLDPEDNILKINSEPVLNDEFERTLFNYIWEAKGDDEILTDKEFKKFLIKSKEFPMKFTESIKEIGREYLIKQNYLEEKSSKKYYLTEKGMSETANLYAFERFVNDFTLISEKEPIDVALWDEILVVATLLGAGEDILESFKKFYPDYQYSGSNNIYVHYLYLNSFSKNSYNQVITTAAYGGGGSASFGGGGGFSGGGYGGGGR